MRPVHFHSCLSRRRLHLAAAGCTTLASLGLSGCQSITANSTEAAQVRVINVASGSPAMDVYLNGNATAYNLSSGTVTSYIPVVPGEARLSLYRANAAQTLVSTRTALGASRQYTVIVSNTLASLQENVYPDANAAASAGTLGVRLLHAAATVGHVDAYLVMGTGSLAGATLLARDLGYTGDGGYVNVPAGGSYTLMVVAAGVAPAATGAVLLSGVSVSGGSGAERTVVLGEVPQGRGKWLSALVLTDFDTP